MIDHPIYQLLSARLALIEQGIDSSSLWFYGDRTPIAEAVIRQWAADHADRVTIEPGSVGFNIEHRTTFEQVVSWYSSYSRCAGRAVAS